MFNSLEEQIRRDDQAASTLQQRWMYYALVLLISIVVFGGLYAGIRFLQ